MNPESGPRWPSAEFVRYLIASAVALSVDTAVLSGGLRVLEMPLAVAATAGFLAGAAVIYLVSVYWVFETRSLDSLPQLEAATFIGIGVVGLGLTQVVLWVGVTRLQLVPEAVKLVAAGVTFIFNYLLRKSLLFAARAPVSSVERAA